VTPRARAIDLPAGTFHYLSWGDEHAAPILLLHGFPDHPHSWAPVAERLAAAGYRAVAPWMRGYFPSVAEGPYDLPRLGADAAALAGALADRPIAVVGHDWGAAATYAAIAASPERFACAVTLSVPHPLAFVRALRRPAQLRRSWYMFLMQVPLAAHLVQRRDFALVDRLWRAWSPGYRLPAHDRERLHRCLAASMPAPILYYRAWARGPRAALRGLRRITTPVRYLHGADDGCIGPEVATGQERWFCGPHDSAVIDGAGHFLQLEQPAAVATQILSWVARHADRDQNGCDART
jgi:pimeloyl-ACP methyl ester carboxylesterase